MLTPNDNCELYIEPQLDTIYAPGQPAGYFADYSGKNRAMVADSDYPFYSTPALNGKAAIAWLGANKPLKNSAVFPVHCGWIVARYGGAAFSTYNGLLTDLNSIGVLVGNGNGSTNFYDFGIEFYEFRSNDRIHPASNAPAPMNAWRVIFFRFWSPVVFNGVQLGQQFGLTDRKWSGSVALLALYSRSFIESDIRRYSKVISDNFALPLADVYPYQADTDGVQENPAQSVNFYQPPEGERISEVLGNPKRVLDLKFSSADQKELQTMKSFHAAHYAPALRTVYRDYRVTPPEDIEGYIDSQYQADGANNDFSYGFRFKEK